MDHHRKCRAKRQFNRALSSAGAAIVKLFCRYRWLILWLVLGTASDANAADFLVDAQRLLEVSQYQQAYDLLKSKEYEVIGDAEYDRVLAEAAAGAGEHGAATLALERLLQMNPAAVDARLQLAQYYAVLGNHEQAKYQLEKAIADTTSSSLQQQASTELTSIDEKLAKRRKRPVFNPSIASNIEIAQPSNDAQKNELPATQKLKPALQAAIAQAQSSLRQGQPSAAYETLVKFEYDGAGNVEFDYLLGVAALEAGKPDKATLALERVIASDPNYAGARIDMGRAYMLLGDFNRANDEFVTALEMNPPEVVRARVMGFVAEMKQRASPPKTKWSGFFGIALGRDSNVNNAPGNAEQFIPGLLDTVVLDPDSVETPSNYSVLAGRIQVDHRVTERFGVYAGFDLNLRRNFQAPQFDSSSGELRVGGTTTLSNHELDFSLALGKTFLDSQPGRSSAFLEHPLYRNVFGGTAQWRFNVNERNQLQTTAQYNRLRYPDEATSVFDSDQTLVGLSWLHAFGANSQGLWFLGSYLGRESDIRGNPSGRKDFYGFRLGGQYGVASNWAIFGALGLMSADYDRFQAIHQKTRDDKRYDVNVGMSYGLWESWSLRPQLSLTRQGSSIGLYEFNRTEISVTLRRDWR
jgi:outer membrane protein